MPTGAQLLISCSEAVQGSTTEKTFCSRMRRAMSCVYCAPKSRMTMDWLSDDSLSLDWGSTDEFLKSDGPCKGPSRRDVACNVLPPANRVVPTSVPPHARRSKLRLHHKVRNIAEDRLIAVN